MAIGDRRYNDRAAKAEKTELHWNDATQQTVHAVGSLADLSPSGARVLVDRPVPVNTPIRISVANQERTGSVRWCVKRMRGYSIGVQFDLR